MGLIPVRNRLVYPGGRPGINPTHPASARLWHASVAISGQPGYINLVTGAALTDVSGAKPLLPVARMDGLIGPSAIAQSNSQALGVFHPSETINAATFAGIFRYRSTTSGAVYQAISTFNNGWGIYALSDRINVYTNTDNFAGPNPLAFDTPYFVATSFAFIGAGSSLNIVVKNLVTGQVYPFSGFTSLNQTTGGSSFCIGTDNAGEFAPFPIAVAMASTNNLLTLPQLLQWADAPWELWYPNQFDLAQAIQTSAAAPVVVDSGQPLLTKTPLKPMARRFPLFNFDLPQPSGVSGTLAVTETTDTAAFAGDVVISATLAATETTDIAAFSGSVIVSGTLAATEATDTAAFAGAVGTSGQLAATEAQDIAAFNGSVVVSGTLVATEATDTAAFNGSVVVSGTLAATEGVDTANFNGAVGTSGTLAVTEAKDIAAFAGDVKISATLAATEATDVAAFAGSVIVSGTLAATEAKDVAAFAGSVIVSGTLAATETTDTAAFAGTVVTGIGVSLAATETTDTAAFVGNVRINAALAATETQDIAAFAGFPFISGVSGTLAANEQPDTARISGLLDTIAILGQPGDLNFGIPNVFVRTLRW